MKYICHHFYLSRIQNFPSCYGRILPRPSQMHAQPYTVIILPWYENKFSLITDIVQSSCLIAKVSPLSVFNSSTTTYTVPLKCCFDEIWKIQQSDQAHRYHNDTTMHLQHLIVNTYELSLMSLYPQVCIAIMCSSCRFEYTCQITWTQTLLYMYAICSNVACSMIVFCYLWQVVVYNRVPL